MDCWDVNDNLSKEITSLKEEIITLKKINKYMKNISQKIIMPRIQTKSVNEYNTFIEEINDCLDKIRSYFDYLHEFDTCETIINKLILIEILNKPLIELITNDLFTLLHHKNKSWCEQRINNSLQTILPLLLSFSSGDHINSNFFDTETTLTKDKLITIISDTFIDGLIDFSTDDEVITNIYEIPFFVCHKCKTNSTDLLDNTEILLCSDCKQDYKIVNQSRGWSQGMEPEPQIELVEALEA